MHHDLTTRGRTAPTPKETEEHVLTEDGTMVATIRAEGRKDTTVCHTLR